MAAALRRFLNTPFKQHVANARADPTSLRRVALYAVEATLILHVFVKYTYEVRAPFGISMIPTLASDGEAMVIDKTCRRGRNIKVGDLVAFNHPVAETQAIKRVIGMPGDFVLAGTPEAKGGPFADKMIQVRCQQAVSLFTRSN